MRNYKLEKLQDGKDVITSEKGNSMAPLIESGQLHKLTPIEWKDCNKDDIIYCKVKGSFYSNQWNILTILGGV